MLPSLIALLQALVSFKDRVKLFNVLGDKLKPFKEAICKNCKEIRYSNGGHLWAAASTINVCIFDRFVVAVALWPVINVEFVHLQHYFQATGHIPGTHFVNSEAGVVSWRRSAVFCRL
jgi:hypothetical protein